MEKLKINSNKSQSRHSEIFDFLRHNEDLSNYSIKEKNILGEGTFGCVFSATDKKTNFPCAIKNFILDPMSFESMKDEILNLFALPHSHIIQPLNYYLDKKNNYVILVMEKADMSLKQLVFEKGTGLEPEYLIQIILDLLTALNFAYTKKGISHSDIKLNNILVFTDIDRDQQKDTQNIFVKEKRHLFKLGDWGFGQIALQSIDHTTKWNDWIGETLPYAAPEIVNQEKEINLAKADIYSLGLCILACCGVTKKELSTLNQKPSEEDHREYLEKRLRKHDIENKYGKAIVNLLENMISFKAKARPKISKIFLVIDEIIKEIKKDFQCVICEKIHPLSEMKTLTNCKHQIGIECLKGFFKTKFSKNIFYIPKCPLSECQIYLETEEIPKILDSKIFKKYFSCCVNCEKISYKSYFIKLSNCRHRLCENCFRGLKNTKKMRCPLSQCQEKINEFSLQEYKDKKKICYNCGDKSTKIL